jgi:hypothetical protein
MLLDSLHHFLVYAHLIFDLTSFVCAGMLPRMYETHRVEQGPEAIHRKLSHLLCAHYLVHSACLWYLTASKWVRSIRLLS